MSTAGSDSVTVTDQATGDKGSESAQVTPVFAGLKLTQTPASATAGVSNSFVVTAVDTTGATLTGYTGTVQFTSSDGQAVLPASYTFTAANGGSHSFSATFKTAGSETLTATDASSGDAAQFTVPVAPAALKTFSVTGLPSPDQSGSVQSIVVTALDAYGNTASGYLGTVSFSSNDPLAVLPANYTFTAADAGVHTFNVTLNTAGSDSVTVTDQATSDKGSESAQVSPVFGGLKLTQTPASATAGVSSQFVVTAVDTTGATLTGYTGTVQFTSSDGQAVLPASYTFTAANGGSHTFNATFKTAGSQTLTATDQSSGDAAQFTVPVAPAALKTFNVTGLPSPDTAGTVESIVVTALDAYGNTASGYLGTVAFTSSDPLAVLPANYTFTAADAGMHTFNVTLNTTGSSRSVIATDQATGDKGSEAVQVTPAPEVFGGFTVTEYPVSTTAGVFNQFLLTAVDTTGATFKNYTGTVQFTSSDPQAVLPASYTFTAADAGTHIFSDTFKTAGNQTLTASDTMPAFPHSLPWR